MEILMKLMPILIAILVIFAIGNAQEETEYTLGDYQSDHMHEEHKISDYTQRSFFLMHDTNRDNELDRTELEALYSTHATTEVSDITKELVQGILERYDQDGDGALSADEYAAAARGKQEGEQDNQQHQQQQYQQPQNGDHSPLERDFVHKSRNERLSRANKMDMLRRQHPIDPSRPHPPPPRGPYHMQQQQQQWQQQQNEQQQQYQPPPQQQQQQQNEQPPQAAKIPNKFSKKQN